jgi:hypothetical protein
VRCCSSVVEHSIGNGEVDSSILSSSTRLSQAISPTVTVWAKDDVLRQVLELNSRL